MNKVPISFTGHRPEKLGGYAPASALKLRLFARQFLEAHQAHISKVYSGMALGWDQAVAAACVDLKIPFVAAVPFAGQESAWPQSSQAQFRRFLVEASEVVVVCTGGYAAWKMQTRNEFIVDNSRLVVALWDGSSGGTTNCVSYAETQKKLVKNLWNSWVSF